MSLLPYADELIEAFALGPLVTAPEPKARGQQGVVWRFDTETGSYAVKHILDRTTLASVQTDVAFQEVMLRRADLLLPAPVTTKDGIALVEIDGLQVRAHTWVDLLPGAGRYEPDQVGRVFAAIHRDPIPADGPVDSWYVDSVVRGEWHRLADCLEAADAPFAGEFAAFAVDLQDLQKVTSAPKNLQLCHRDLWMDNAPATPEGRICVLDWENCGAADPGQELAATLYECCSEDPTRAAALYEAYVLGGGTGRLTGRGSFSMVIAELGHFAVTAAQRWLVDTDESERTRNEAWFREGYDQPLTVDLIDALLAAVA